MKRYVFIVLVAFMLMACTISTLPTVTTTHTTNQHPAEMRWQQTPVHEIAQPEADKPREWQP